MRKRWWSGGALAVAALVAAVPAWRFGVRSIVPAAEARAAHTPAGTRSPVLEFTADEAARPVAMALPQVIEFSGALVSPNTASVHARAPGTLLELAVHEGDRVRAGQVLGRIDLSELTSRVAERRANLESALAALAQAERTHQSNVGLAEAHFISPVALDSSRLQLEAARAQADAAQAALDGAQVTLRDASLVAPIGGIVARRYVVAGEKLAAEQPVVDIVDLHQLELDGTVATQEVPRLRPGMEVQVRVEGIDTPLPGQLARIAPAADPGARAIGVVVQLANPHETMRAGQYAVARVEIGDTRPRLTVPLGAIASASGQDYVWTIEQGLLLRRTVSTGRKDAVRGRVEVLEGLKPEAYVLGARFDNLREGAQARIVASAAR